MKRKVEGSGGVGGAGMKRPGGDREDRHRKQMGEVKREHWRLQGLVGQGTTGGFCNNTLLNLGRKGSDGE